MNTSAGPNDGRAIEIRSGDYLPIDGTFFAKDYFFVFRSPPANPVWSGYGGPMGHNPSSGHNQRNSNYITHHNSTYFHSNQYRDEVFKNGTAFSGNFYLSYITDYMIVRLVVNDSDQGPYSSYQIGRVTGLQCNLDIAEILAFGNKLSDIDASLVEHYLGEKWDLNNIPGTTILDFATGQANNDDLANTFASNLSSSISGATVINGGTPNITLEWYASSNVLELHGSGNSYWNQIDPGSSGVNVLQLDLDGGEEDPYIVFTVDSGKALFLDSVVIGHGSFQSKEDHAWTISITEVGGVEAFTHTTAVMGINDSEFVDFNFTGKFGSSYILNSAIMEVMATMVPLII